MVVQFGQAVGALFGGLTSAVNVLNQLRDYARVPESSIQNFIADVQRLLDEFYNWIVRYYEPEVGEAVEKWGAATGSRARARSRTG